MRNQYRVALWRCERSNRARVTFFHPYSDADLIELLCSIPPQQLNAGGRSKGLVRGSLSRRFPTLGFERQRKVMSTSFFQQSLRQEGAALVQAVGDFPALSELGIVDGPKAAHSISADLADKENKRLRIWDVIKIEMWVRGRIS